MTATVLVSTSSKSGITRLYTYDDPKDFPFEELEILRP